MQRNRRHLELLFPSWRAARDQRRRLLSVIAATFLCAMGASAEDNVVARPASGTVIRTHAMGISLGGHVVGSLVGRDLKTANGFVFERTQDLELQRGETTLVLHVESRATVDASLRPIESEFVKVDASGRQVTRSHVEGKNLIVEVTQSGSTVRKSSPLDPALTYYSAFEHEIRENLRAGFSKQRPIFVEEMGGIFPMTVTVAADAAALRMPSGENVVGAKYQATIVMESLTTNEFYDGQGRVLLSLSPAVNSVAWPLGGPLPAGVSADKSDIMAVTTWAIEPLEGQPKSIRYRVWSENARDLDIPEDSRQRVVNRTDKYVDIYVAGPRATQGRLRAGDRRRYLSETQFEAVDDKEIIAAATRATKGATSTMEKVEKLTAFVHDLVKTHELDRAYAPAVTTLKERKGDCTEKSVLLSALLKSQGIPTRLVEGVVVSGNVLGYHEWVEAQIDDVGFFPADPTFGEFPASAARLKFVQATSDPEGILSFAMASSRMMRRGVKIEILEASY